MINFLQHVAGQLSGRAPCMKRGSLGFDPQSGSSFHFQQPRLSFPQNKRPSLHCLRFRGPTRGSIPVGREKKGQTGDRTRASHFHAGCSTTELPSRLIEESSTLTILSELEQVRKRRNQLCIC